ncbi:inner membrane complex suture component [Plasmodium yoelii yoelii]|uniref:Inner membrane complex suture component n=1 Tax=Plasmodium yoelii yoelii TaxID=73239 RepID=A0AAE9WSX2_PLAYO|nr:inner membrane complex suture component [Plasmodium yoelii yoelii]
MSMTLYPYVTSCHISSKKLTNSTSPAAALHGISYITNIIFPGFTTMIITFFAFNIFNNFQTYNNIFSPRYIPNPFFSALVIKKKEAKLGFTHGMLLFYFAHSCKNICSFSLYASYSIIGNWDNLWNNHITFHNNYIHFF